MTHYLARSSNFRLRRGAVSETNIARYCRVASVHFTYSFSAMPFCIFSHVYVQNCLFPLGSRPTFCMYYLYPPCRVILFCQTILLRPLLSKTLTHFSHLYGDIYHSRGNPNAAGYRPQKVDRIYRS